MADDWRNVQIYPTFPGPSGEGIWYNAPEQDRDLDFTDRPSEDGSSGHDIEYLRPKIMNMHPEDISALADQWTNTWYLLNDIEQQVLRTSTVLYEQDWQDGAAREAFMMKGPGETLAYIREWKNSVMDDVAALRAQVEIVRQARQEVETLWSDYLRRLEEAQHVDTSTRLWEGFWHYNLIPGGDQSEYENAIANHRMQQINDVKQEFALKAQRLAWNTAESVQDTYPQINNGHGPLFYPMNAIMTPIGSVMVMPDLGGLPEGPPGLASPAVTLPKVSLPSVTMPALQQLQQQAPQQLQQQAPQQLQQQAPQLPSTGRLGQPANLALPAGVDPAGLAAGVPGVVPPTGLAASAAAAAAANQTVARAPSAVTRLSPHATGLSNGIIQAKGLSAPSAEVTPGAIRSPGAAMPPTMPPPGRARPTGQPPAATEPKPGPGTAHPAGIDETFRGTPAGTAPPVLNNQRPAGQHRPGSREELFPRSQIRDDAPAPVRPAGTVPPVLSSPGQGTSQVTPPARPGTRRGRAPVRGQPGRPAPVSEWVGVEEARAEASAPVLDAPAPVTGAKVSGLEEAKLRGRAAAPAGAARSRPPSTVAPELTARRTTAGAASADLPEQAGDGQRIITDEEAFTVHTPGGGVVAKKPEDTSYRVEPPAALGGSGQGATVS